MACSVIDEIIEENRWRDGEFAKFKVNSKKVEESLWNRMCLPMIYAHWEGYVVNSLKILIGHLNELELQPNDVETNIIVLGLADSYKPLSGKQSFNQRCKFTNDFKVIFQSAIKFEKTIDTKSNLNSKVLNQLCEIFGFSFEVFSEVTSDIDRIVTFRNKIAHGENSIIPITDSIEKYITSVTTATDFLLNEIDRFLLDENYLVKIA